MDGAEHGGGGEGKQDRQEEEGTGRIFERSGAAIRGAQVTEGEERKRERRPGSSRARCTRLRARTD